MRNCTDKHRYPAAAMQLPTPVGYADKGIGYPDPGDEFLMFWRGEWRVVTATIPFQNNPQRILARI